MRNPAFWLIYLAAALCLSVGATFAQEIAPTGVTFVVNRDGVNVRLLPALGAEVIGHVNAGYVAQVYARSPDNEWFKIRFSGEEGWIGSVVVTILEGDINTVPVSDPRTIPYGGFESPRAGLTDATSPIMGKLEDNGVRVRGGPSRAYPVLANAPRYTIFPLLGRTYNNAWFQVNFDGTLGWVSAPEVTIQGAHDITQLPIDGIIANAVPFSQPTEDDYLGTLRFMRDRVNLAQPSLDAARQAWTAIALGDRSVCGNYPPRPTDYHIPNPLLAAFYTILNPLQTLFNDAMTNVRTAIDIWIEVCSFAQPPEGSVGEAAVRNALDYVNAADAQFAELRRRLNELIPPELVPGPNECLFEYATAAELLPLLQTNRIYLDRFTAKDWIQGYCFDAVAGQVLTINFQRLSGNIAIFGAVSPIDNPTQFLAAQRGSPDSLTLSLIVNVPADGRYLIIVTDIGGEVQQRLEPPEGEFGILISDPMAGVTIDTSQAFDVRTNEAVTGFDLTRIVPFSVVTPGAIQPTIVVTPGVFITPMPITGACPGLNLTCELLTCEQAQACLQAGNFTLDADDDGIACEESGCI